MQRKSTMINGRNNGEKRGERKTQDVVFRAEKPQAQAVYLVGDFNGWSPRTLRMLRRGENGKWERRIPLPPGRYEYKFVVDNEWVHDDQARENKPNAHGSLNSIVEVLDVAIRF
jgi:1,4-alpha-glucan branching enzyme